MCVRLSISVKICSFSEKNYRFCDVLNRKNSNTFCHFSAKIPIFALFWIEKVQIYLSIFREISPFGCDLNKILFSKHQKKPIKIAFESFEYILIAFLDLK